MNSPAPKPPSMFAVPKPPSPVPAGGKPKAEEPAPKPARGRSVALLGLPSSGKTSYLYALTHTSARGRHRWIIGLHTKEFERLTGDPNERQEGTPVGEFRPARLFEMSRPWLGALGLRRGPGPAREVVIPEIAGETVERYALGRELKDAERTAVGKLKAYLHHSDEVLFLVGIDGAQGTGRLRPESVEAAMLGSVKALRTVLKDMQDGRERDEPIFVSLLVTKRDRLRGTPMDRVRLRSAESALARLARRPGFRWLASEGLVVDGGEEVAFGINDVCGHARARHDLDVQEAAAADFLRCHAPRAAADLADLAAQPGISLRLLTIAPYGAQSLDASGAAVFPPVTKITPSLVFESLEDLVERRFRRQARTRIAWLTAALAAVLVVAVAFGPAWTWHFRGKARQAIAAKRWPDAGRVLVRAAAVPWWRVEIAAPRRAEGDAELIKQVLDGLGGANQREQFKQVAAELERMWDRVDPAGADERRSAGAAGLVAYISGSAGAPDDQIKLDQAAVTQVIAELGRTSERRKEDFQWNDFKTRCEKLKDWLAKGTVTFLGAAADARDRLSKAVELGVRRADLMSSKKKPRDEELSERKLEAVGLGEFGKLEELSRNKDGGSPTRVDNSISSERRIEDQQEALKRLEDLNGKLEQFAKGEALAPKDLVPGWALDVKSTGLIEDIRVRDEFVRLFEKDWKEFNPKEAELSAKNWKSIAREDEKISVLGVDGERVEIDLGEVVSKQGDRLSQRLDELADDILSIDADQKRREWEGAVSRIRTKVKLNDVLVELKEQLDSCDREPDSVGAGTESSAVKDASKTFEVFEVARKRNAARLCNRLSKKDGELVKSFARLASKDPEAAATMLGRLDDGPTTGNKAKEQDVLQAIETILREVDWAKLWDEPVPGVGSRQPARAGLGQLACAGLDGDQGRCADRRKFLGELLRVRVASIVNGSESEVRQHLRGALALDAARAAVDSCDMPEGKDSDPTPRPLPVEIAEKLAEAFYVSEKGVGGALWVPKLLNLKELEEFEQCKQAKKHFVLIENYKLLPVWSAKEGRVICYLGSQELTRDDLGLPGEPDGQFPKVRLGLTLEKLSDLLKQRGLRLPTDPEWLLIAEDERFHGVGQDGVREWVTIVGGGGLILDKSFAGGPYNEDDLGDVGGRAALDATPFALSPSRKEGMP